MVENLLIVLESYPDPINANRVKLDGKEHLLHFIFHLKITFSGFKFSLRSKNDAMYIIAKLFSKRFFFLFLQRQFVEETFFLLVILEETIMSRNVSCFGLATRLLDTNNNE